MGSNNFLLENSNFRHFFYYTKAFATPQIVFFYHLQTIESGNFLFMNVNETKEKIIVFFLVLLFFLLLPMPEHIVVPL